MRYTLIYILGLLISSAAYGQTITLDLGLLKHGCCENYSNSSYPLSELYVKPEKGFQLNLSVSEIQINPIPIPLKFTVNLNSQEEFSSYTYSDLVGGLTTEVDIKTIFLGLSFFPINLTIQKRLMLSFGFRSNFLLRERFNGFEDSWTEESFNRESISHNTSQLSNKHNMGVVLELSYKTKIKRPWRVVPKYSLFWGLSDVYSFAPNYKPIKHGLNLCFIIPLNKPQEQ